MLACTEQLQRLLQQNLPQTDECSAARYVHGVEKPALISVVAQPAGFAFEVAAGGNRSPYSISSSARASSVAGPSAIQSDQMGRSGLDCPVVPAWRPEWAQEAYRRRTPNTKVPTTTVAAMSVNAVSWARVTGSLLPLPSMVPPASFGSKVRWQASPSR